MSEELQRFEVPKMAFPLIVSNITVPLLALTDSIVVGHLHTAYFLAAVGFGAGIFSFVYWCFGFLRQGTTGFIAQAFGREDLKECVAIFERGIFLALCISIILLVLQKPIAELIHFFLHERKALSAYILGYFYVRIWGVIPTLINYVFNAWFLAIKRTRYCLYLMLVVNGLAIFFDVVLVFGFHMNVKGVALADVLGQFGGMIFGGYFILKQPIVREHLTRFIFQWGKFRELMLLNRDIFLRTFSLMLVYLFFNYQGARLGKDILAANTVLLNLMMLSAYAQDGFNNVSEILVGNSLGKKNLSYFWVSIKRTCFWSFIVSVISAAVYAIFGRYLVVIITSIPAVLQTTYQYLWWVIFAPVISIWGFWLDGVFMGGTWGRELRNGMLISVAAFLVAWYLGRSLGNTGLWLAFMVFFLMRGIAMGWQFVGVGRRLREQI